MALDAATLHTPCIMQTFACWLLVNKAVQLLLYALWP